MKKKKLMIASPTYQVIIWTAQGKKNTWCKCQQDKNNGTSFYRSKADLTIDVRAAILPIYNDLTKQKKNNEMLVWKDAKRK